MHPAIGHRKCADIGQSNWKYIDETNRIEYDEIQMGSDRVKNDRTG